MQWIEQHITAFYRELYENALHYMIKAEKTSNIDSPDEERERKRQKPARYLPSQSDQEGDGRSDNVEHHTQDKNVNICTYC